MAAALAEKWDVVVIGAGAAGMMCAAQAASRGRRTLLIDKAKRPGRKILMSGGGRCNFTNLYAAPEKYLSHNPHFIKSALSQYTQWDFIELVKRYRIPFHEKTLGQLFCDDKAQAIVDLLSHECELAGVHWQMEQDIRAIRQHDNGRFDIQSATQAWSTESLVIATGGLSIPSMGSSPFAYHIAEQFGIALHPTRAGLVPLTWDKPDKDIFAALSGISTTSEVGFQDVLFQEDILFTHRGLSGPAILQISSYWQPGNPLSINFLPNCPLLDMLQTLKQEGQGGKLLKTVLYQMLPKRMVDTLLPEAVLSKTIANLSKLELQHLRAVLQEWTIQPNGTEGYRTAEVTLGGVDTSALSSKTMEARQTPGLYFIGEAVDITGWLGGYNFQWAWSSGYVAGQHA